MKQTKERHEGRGKHAGQRIKDGLETALPIAEVLMRRIKQDAEIPFDESNLFETESLHAFDALNALTLHDLPDDELIRRAFKEANLQWENPWHWRVLMGVFARAYYPGKAQNEFWSQPKLMQLVKWDIELRHRRPKLKPTQIRKAIRKNITDAYGRTVRDETLITLLKKAKRSPVFAFAQRELDDSINEHLQKLTAKYGPNSVTGDISKLKKTVRNLAATMTIAKWSAQSKKLLPQKADETPRSTAPKK